MKLNRIRAVLEDKGISQTWLAKKLGRSFSTVNAYVCNRSQPNLTTLLEIAQLAGGRRFRNRLAIEQPLGQEPQACGKRCWDDEWHQAWRESGG